MCLQQEVLVTHQYLCSALYKNRMPQLLNGYPARDYIFSLCFTQCGHVIKFWILGFWILQNPKEKGSPVPPPPCWLGDSNNWSQRLTHRDRSHILRMQRYPDSPGCSQSGLCYTRKVNYFASYHFTIVSQSIPIITLFR